MPNSTGAVPPPCSDFTFTKINADSAVLFGGNHKGHGYANDVYIVNMRTWVSARGHTKYVLVRT